MNVTQWYRCEVMAYGHERGEIGCAAPYGPVRAYGYGSTPRIATLAADTLAKVLSANLEPDDNGCVPLYGWQAGDVEPASRACACCGEVRDYLVPRPSASVPGTLAPSALMCLRCAEEQPTMPCGCPEVAECDCDEPEGEPDYHEMAGESPYSMPGGATKL